MLRFQWMTAMLPLRNAEGGAGGGSGAPAPATGAPTTEASADFFLALDQRPDFLPETFYDADRKGVRWGELAKSYGQLHAKLGQRADAVRAEMEVERRAGVPASAEAYEWKPDKTKMPAHAEFLMPGADDPALLAARTVIHRLGGKQEDFAAVMDGYLAGQLSSVADPAAERLKLGDGASERIGAVESWLTKHLGADGVAVIGSVISDASVFEQVERLAKAFDQGAGGASGMPGGSVKMTGEGARDLIRDPKYSTPTPEGKVLRDQVYAFIQAGGRVAR